MKDHSFSNEAEAILTKRISDLIADLGHQMPKLQGEREAIARWEAPKFSLFALFPTRETVLSRVLSELLNPFGSHGQGSLFLNRLLTMFELKTVSPNDNVHVQLEAPTAEGRRIDVVISTPKYLIGIENKPWARQSDEQLSDYYADLKSRAGHIRQPQLIFLSSQDPSTAKDNALVLRFARDEQHPSLEKLLDDTLPKVRAPQIRKLVQDFLHFIQINFAKGGVAMASEDMLIEAVTEKFHDARSRQAIAACLMAGEALHARVLSDIGASLLLRLQQEVHADFKVNEGATLADCLSNENEPWLLRRPSWVPEVGVALQSESGENSDVFFGVITPGAKKQGRDPEKGRLASYFEDLPAKIEGATGHSQDWPWWAMCSEPLWDQQFIARLLLDAPDGDVTRHQQIRAMGDLMVALARSTDERLANAQADRKGK